MHAVTATSMHPNGIYYAGQSSDNKVLLNNQDCYLLA